MSFCDENLNIDYCNCDKCKKELRRLAGKPNHIKSVVKTTPPSEWTQMLRPEIHVEIDEILETLNNFRESEDIEPDFIEFEINNDNMFTLFGLPVKFKIGEERL